MCKKAIIFVLSCFFLSLASGYTPLSTLPSSLRGKSSKGAISLSPNQAAEKFAVSLHAGAQGATDNKTEESCKKATIKELLGEFIGTFIIVQIGTGSVMSDIFCASTSGLFQIAAIWAFAVTIAISTTASVSGAHLNPSITLSFALLRGFQWNKVVPFVVAQTLGAIAASATNFALFGAKIKVFEQANNIVRGTSAGVLSARAFGEYISNNISFLTAFFAEAFGTGVLAFVIFSLTNPKNKVTHPNEVLVPPLIGATVGALITVIAPLTQAGFNPARDFGPRIVAWIAGWKNVAFTKWWLYVLAPLVGAPIGAALADKVLYSDD